MDGIPPFDTNRFYLGKLCPRNHEFENTGKSLRSRNKRTCTKCGPLGRIRWEQRNPELAKQRKRETDLRRAFNITSEQYTTLLTEQNEVCAICGMAQTYKRLAVDHNHKTGQIRGLLCDKCNIGLGAFQDNPDYLLAAIHYLNQHSHIP